MEREQGEESPAEVPDWRPEKQDPLFKQQKFKKDEGPLEELLHEGPGREPDVELLRAEHVGRQAGVQVLVGLVDEVEPGEVAFAEVSLRDQGHLDLEKQREHIKTRFND